MAVLRIHVTWQYCGYMLHGSTADTCYMAVLRICSCYTAVLRTHVTAHDNSSTPHAMVGLTLLTTIYIQSLSKDDNDNM